MDQLPMLVCVCVDGGWFRQEGELSWVAWSPSSQVGGGKAWACSRETERA